MIGVVDTHAHYWRADPRESAAVAHYDQPLDPDEYVALMDAAAVSHLTQITRYFDEDDHYSLEGVRRHPSRFRVIGRFRMEFLEEPGLLEEWRRDERLIALRVFARENVSRLFDDASAGFWTELERLAIPVSFYAPGWMRQLRDVALSHPKLAIALDHVGADVFPETPADARHADWDDALAFADLPQIVAKISGQPEATLEAFPYPRAQQRVHDVIDAFGAERVMWGSNFTPAVRVGSYGQLVAFARRAVAHLPEHAQRAVLRDTAGAFFDISSWLESSSPVVVRPSPIASASS